MWNRDGQSYSWVWKSWRGVIFRPYPFLLLVWLLLFHTCDLWQFGMAPLLVHSLSHVLVWNSNENALIILFWNPFSYLLSFIFLFNSLSSLNILPWFLLLLTIFFCVIIFDQRKGTNKLDVWSREMILKFFC